VWHLVAKHLKHISASTDGTDAASRTANAEVKVGYISSHNRTHADHCPSTNRQVAADQASGTDRDARSYKRLFGKIIWFTWQQSGQIGCCRAWVTIVGENGSRRDHNSVFDCDTGTNINGGIDFAPMTDHNVISDVGFSADDTFITQTRVVANVDVVPDRRTVANADVPFDRSSRMDAVTHG
jgi:hypothetical protein